MAKGFRLSGPKKDYTNYGATFLFTPNDRFEALLTIEQYDDGSDVGAWTNENDDTTLICNLYDPVRGVPALVAQYNPGRHPTCKSTANLGPTENATNDHNPGQFDTDAYTLNMTYDLSDSMTLTYVGAYREEGEQTTWEYDGTGHRRGHHWIRHHAVRRHQNQVDDGYVHDQSAQRRRGLRHENRQRGRRQGVVPRRESSSRLDPLRRWRVFRGARKREENLRARTG